MDIRRGYVKWTDEDGVFHKEPLYEHPELLEQASAAEKAAAEEVRLMHLAAEPLPAEEEETDEPELWLDVEEE